MRSFHTGLRCLSLLCAVAALLALSASCSREKKAPHELLLSLLDEEKTIPAGRIYLRTAEESSRAYLSDALLAQAFGNGALPPAVDGIVDAACYFSYAHPYELDVFLCTSAASAQAVAKMCLRRLDVLKNYRTYEGLDADTVAAYLNNATVTVRGKYVIFRVAE